MGPRFLLAWLISTLLIWPLVAAAQIADFDHPRGSISGTVFTADGRPAAGVKVSLQPYASGPTLEVFTRAGGEFELGQLPSGAYFIVVEAQGYEPIQETVELVTAPPTRLLLHLQKAGSAQLSVGSHLVSARELSIPPKAHIALQKGLERLGKKDPAGSLAQFQRAAAAFPNYYEAYYEMGMALRNLRRDAEAEGTFRKSIEMSGGRYAAPHFALGLLLCDRKRFAEAEPVIRKGLELDAGSGLGHFTLAWTLFGLNRLDEAEKNAREAAIREPNLAQAHLLLANMFILQRDYRELPAELDAFLKLEPNGAMSARARQILEAVKKGIAPSGDIIAATATKH